MKDINHIDVEPLLVKAIDNEEGLGWDLDFAISVSKEYLKFLELCMLNPDVSIVPSSHVDEFWHLHILDTQKYYEDCENHLGFFLHHFPYFGMRGKEDEANLKKAWINTKEIYQMYYGEIPDPIIWQASNRCPNCGKRCSNTSGVFFEERPTLNSKSITTS